MRNALLTIHVVVSVGLVGADLALLALGIAGTAGADPRTVAPAASLVASGVVAPLVVAALLTGVALVVRSGPGLLRYWWVTIKLATTLVFTGIVLGLLVPRLAASADPGTAPAAGAAQLPLVLVPALAITVLVGLAALGITKPRWRWDSATPRPSKSSSATPLGGHREQA